MYRPSFRPSPSQRAIGRNLALDLMAAVGVGVTMALVNALLPTIARRGGLEPLGLAALAAAPFVANFLGAFAGRFGPRSTRQLSLMRGLGAASLVLLFVAPVPAVMIVVALLFWGSISFGGPFHLRLWGAMYPSRLRGRVVGLIGMGRAAAGALAAFTGGLIADLVGGPTAVATAGVLGVACALAYAGLRARSADGAPRFSARESIRALRERPVLARMALAQGFYGGGFIAAAPLYALVFVDRLDLTLAEVGVIGILTSTSTMVAFLVWGSVADRMGPLVAIRIGSAIGLASLVGYAVAPDVAVLWFAALAAGTASASVDVAIAGVVSDQTPLASRAAAMAGWNALTGARGIVAAFLMSGLLQAGLVDVTTGLLLCAASSGIGVALFVRTKPGVPVESRAWEIVGARVAAT
ncbi:MAG TPA: MFS transporter [Candidatus Limnocylindrales bacterium]|nr:MFS transporter [Candidatus Limnocylindrales bacterium]